MKDKRVEILDGLNVFIWRARGMIGSDMKKKKKKRSHVN